MSEDIEKSRHNTIDNNENSKGKDVLQDIECGMPNEINTGNIPCLELEQSMPALVLDKPETIAQKKARSKYARKRLWPWILLSILLLLLIIAGGILLWVDSQNVRLVTFNGEKQLMTDVSPEKFVDLYDNLRVTFAEEGHSVSYSYKELGIQVQWTDAQEAKFDEFEINLDNMYFYFNYSQKLKDTIYGLNKNKKDWISATFTETEEGFIVTPEQRGNKVDIEAIEDYVIQNFGLTDLSINLDDFRIPEPEDFVTDVEYNNELFKLSSFYIKYTNGFEITAEDITPYFTLTEDYKIVFNPEKKDALSEQVWKWVSDDLNSYNTLGGIHHFLTHDGQVVDLKGVNYGDKIHKQKEHDFLMDLIEKLWACPKRIPEMEIDYPDIQNNVIEISLEQQHLWYWQNGEVYMETDVVTGWKNKWDTPKGVYRILNQIDGVYLIGDDYKTWVDKWMRFWNGYGLHDATWRKKFGGTIYTRDGSHGCINLPHSFAVKLYDMVEPGDCVVIY